MPRTENKTTPKVYGGVLYHESGGFSVGSAEWWLWLNEATTFYYADNAGQFTARRRGDTAMKRPPRPAPACSSCGGVRRPEDDYTPSEKRSPLCWLCRWNAQQHAANNGGKP